MGAALAVAPKVRAWRRAHPRAIAIVGGIALVVFVAALHVSAVRRMTGSQLARDFLTGIAFTTLVYLLLHNESPTRRDGYQRISKLLAGFSYTLYVTHLPILVFVRAATTPVPLATGWQTVTAATLLTAVCLAYALAIARVTEGQTDRVRRAVTELLGKLAS
jgi:peptidoglycan/LPS O-acetylase OafA/YrhL